MKELLNQINGIFKDNTDLFTCLVPVVSAILSWLFTRHVTLRKTRSKKAYEYTESCFKNIYLPLYMKAIEFGNKKDYSEAAMQKYSLTLNKKIEGKYYIYCDPYLINEVNNLQKYLSDSQHKDTLKYKDETKFCICRIQRHIKSKYFSLRKILGYACNDSMFYNIRTLSWKERAPIILYFVFVAFAFLVCCYDLFKNVPWMLNIILIAGGSDILIFSCLLIYYILTGLHHFFRYHGIGKPLFQIVHLVKKKLTQH